MPKVAKLEWYEDVQSNGYRVVEFNSARVGHDTGEVLKDWDGVLQWSVALGEVEGCYPVRLRCSLFVGDAKVSKEFVDDFEAWAKEQMWDWVQTFNPF